MAEPDRNVSFLEEQRSDDRRDLRRQLVRWGLAFGLLFAGVFVALWWSGSAVRFGASRVTQSTAPSYRVWGMVRDATHNPVPWAEISDDPFGRPPICRTTADQNGAYELMTLAELHDIRVVANGYRILTVPVGKRWFVWWPSGSEPMDLELTAQEK